MASRAELNSSVFCVLRLEVDYETPSRTFGPRLVFGYSGRAQLSGVEGDGVANAPSPCVPTYPERRACTRALCNQLPRPVKLCLAHSKFSPSDAPESVLPGRCGETLRNGT